LFGFSTIILSMMNMVFEIFTERKAGKNDE